MTQQQIEWQHDGCADGDHCDCYDRTLMAPRPWPKMNGAQWFMLGMCAECVLLGVMWLVTK